MKLDSKEFKRFKELSAKVKAGKASEAEKAELDDLLAKKNTRGSNDLQWWANYPELLKGVTNLPFNWIPGTKVGLINFAANFAPLNLGNIAIAKVAPAIGKSESDADAFNTQIRQLWLDMHRKYRGIGAYQKADLGMMLLAINSYFEVIAKFERLYGVINTYHIGNRVVPNGLKDALGISANLEANLADFRYILNLYIEKGKQLCLPKGLSILASDLIAISNLFKDSKDRRAFIFGFDIDEFGVFRGDLVNSSSQAIGSAVVFEDFGSNNMNDVTPSGYNAFDVTDVRNILEAMVSHLLNDDDVQIMCSDLLAAYGADNVMTLIPVPEDYKVEPVEDYERSLQFHNMSIVGRTSSIFLDSVIDNTMANAFRTAAQRHVYYQFNNTIMCELGVSSDTNLAVYVNVSGKNFPTFTTNDPEYEERGKNYDFIFDTWAETPGDTEIMCGSRYSATSDLDIVVSTNNRRRNLYTYGSKVVEKVEVWSYRPGYTDYYVETIYGSVIEDSRFNGSKEKFLHLTQMDWAPILYINDSGDLTLFGDIDNFTIINQSNLSRLHEVALLSGYKIPMAARD